MKVKFDNESIEPKISLSLGDYEFIYKKLEYTFKKSGDPLVNKILNKEELSNDDLTLLLKKFEYTFRKSNPEIIERIKNHLGIPCSSNILYRNILTKRKRDLKGKENGI